MKEISKNYIVFPTFFWRQHFQEKYCNFVFSLAYLASRNLKTWLNQIAGICDSFHFCDTITGTILHRQFLFIIFIPIEHKFHKLVLCDFCLRIQNIFHLLTLICCSFFDNFLYPDVPTILSTQTLHQLWKYFYLVLCSISQFPRWNLSFE